MTYLWVIVYSVLATLFIAALAYIGVFLHKATTEDLPNTDAMDKEEDDYDETVTEFYNKLPKEKQETITAFIKAAIGKRDKISSQYIKCFKTEFTDKEKDITYYLIGSAIEKEWSEVSDNE